jgi:hypothetical protein
VPNLDTQLERAKLSMSGQNFAPVMRTGAFGARLAYFYSVVGKLITSRKKRNILLFPSGPHLGSESMVRKTIRIESISYRRQPELALGVL